MIIPWLHDVRYQTIEFFTTTAVIASNPIYGKQAGYDLVRGDGCCIPWLMIWLARSGERIPREAVRGFDY
jgi:hypothetical protein